MTDIEIARNCKKQNIKEVAKKLKLNEEDLILYGDDKAKIKKNIDGINGKLILVTAISPTPLGEGKTTVSIGLADALSSLKKNTVAVLRQPSMGPVFGIKGGATGGGYSQVVPMEDINLHFTGDFHAITSANDLLCAAIDSHIYFGNKLDIQEVRFHRCLDVNDRALRRVRLDNREEVFSITAASEIMALFCLASSIDDLKKRLGNIIIGTNSKGDNVYAKDLHIEGSLVTLLKDAFYPNLVQTLEGTPVIIHGGPFANIAHGCNSVVATKMGLNLADYVVTEAGFGADLGAEKFFDIKCRKSELKPNCVVLVATIKALKYHGGVSKEDVFLENNEALNNGLENLKQHVSNLQQFGVNVIVCLNRFNSDLDSDISIVRECCQELGVSMKVSSAYADGGLGAVDLAKEVIDESNKPSNFKVLYSNEMTIKEKIETLSKKIYHASDVTYSEEAISKINQLEGTIFSKYPLCVAKTQYSFSDDAKKVGVPKNFAIEVKNLEVFNGAEFITIYLGNIMTMPGLSKNPNYEKIDFINGNIEGLS